MNFCSRRIERRFLDREPCNPFDVVPDLTRPIRSDPAITCHFLVYPSIDSDFIDPVQLSDLIFELFKIHSNFSILTPAQAEVILSQDVNHAQLEVEGDDSSVNATVLSKAEAGRNAFDISGSGGSPFKVGDTITVICFEKGEVLQYIVKV